MINIYQMFMSKKKNRLVNNNEKLLSLFCLLQINWTNFFLSGKKVSCLFLYKFSVMSASKT